MGNRKRGRAENWKKTGCSRWATWQTENQHYEQLNLFTDYVALEAEREREQAELAREKKMQLAVLDIKKWFGRNAVLKGMNLEDRATAKERNRQVGEHRA